MRVRKSRQLPSPCLRHFTRLPGHFTTAPNEPHATCSINTMFVAGVKTGAASALFTSPTAPTCAASRTCRPMSTRRSPTHSHLCAYPAPCVETRPPGRLTFWKWGHPHGRLLTTCRDLRTWLFWGSKGRGGCLFPLIHPTSKKKNGEITHGHAGAASSTGSSAHKRSPFGDAGVGAHVHQYTAGAGRIPKPGAAC